MADQDRGHMDITSQQKTFAGFTKIVAYAIVVIALILLFLTTRS